MTAQMTPQEHCEAHGAYPDAPSGWSDFEVCADCLMIIANNDPTGIDDEREADRIIAAVERFTANRPANPIGECGFSHQRCECCNALPGDRYLVWTMDPPAPEPASEPERRAFAESYIEAMEWANAYSGHPDDRECGANADERFDQWSYAHGGKVTLYRDALEFLRDADALALLRTVTERQGYDWSAAGHDLALTRNGHGAGFWDRGLGADGDALSDIAKALGERNIEVVPADADDADNGIGVAFVS